LPAVVWHSTQLLLSPRQRDVIGRQVGRTLEARGIQVTGRAFPCRHVHRAIGLRAGRTLMLGEPTQLLPFSWQVEQPIAVTMLCTIEGGAVPLALVNEKLLKLDEEWQPSQAIVPVGCDWPEASR